MNKSERELQSFLGDFLSQPRDEGSLELMNTCKVSLTETGILLDFIGQETFELSIKCVDGSKEHGDGYHSVWGEIISKENKELYDLHRKLNSGINNT